MELDDGDNDNGFPLVEECKDKSNISRTMPLQLQEPPHWSLRDDTTTITSDANDTRKFFDDTYRQISKKNDPNIALATVGCQNNSIFPIFLIIYLNCICKENLIKAYLIQAFRWNKRFYFNVNQLNKNLIKYIIFYKP
jgi:hypothetical protein